MAGVTDKKNALESLFECGSCHEQYQDPRALYCGHQFCKGCLEGSVSGKEVKSITCATCLQVTCLQTGENVDNLPRLTVVEDLQEAVKKYVLLSKSEEITITCDLCANPKVTASYFCQECQDYFCATCVDRHKGLEGVGSHQLISMELICMIHPKQKIVKHCVDCNQCVCSKCVLRDHPFHKTQEISKIAEMSRGNIAKSIIGDDLLNEEIRVADHMENTLKQVQNRLRTFRDSTSNLRRLIKTIELELDRLEKDTENRLTEQIQQLAAGTASCKCLINAKRKLSDRARYLSEEASTTELVLNENAFPSFINNEIVAGTVQLPDIDNVFAKLEPHLKKAAELCTYTWIESAIYKRPINQHKKYLSFQLQSEVAAFCVDPKSQLLVVRTRDNNAPIKMYDFDGILVHETARGVDGIADKSLRKVSIDTKRSMLLLPCKNSLKLLDKKGRVLHSLQVGSDLRGVAYYAMGDLYVLSDFYQHKIYIIDADTRLVISEFGSEGSRDNQLIKPCDVSVGHITAIEEPVIVVADNGNHCVKVFSLNGQHLHTFGSRGKEDGQLWYPRCAQIDPSGQILVCDEKRERVTLFWIDNDQHRWRCLLQRADCGDQSSYVAFDPVLGIIAVLLNPSEIAYFSESRRQIRAAHNQLVGNYERRVNKTFALLQQTKVQPIIQ